MKTYLALILITILALLPHAGIAQLNATQTQPSPTQVQACLAALPPAPKPPRPQVNLFPGLQQKLDDMLRKAGADPVAMRKAAADAAAQKYLDSKTAYDKQRAACSLPPLPPPLPGTQPVNPFLPNVPPVAPASPVVPAAPTQPQQPK